MALQSIVYTETIMTTVEPKKVIRWAEECLVEIRLVESIQKAGTWRYEFEVRGESGRITKLVKRLRKMETGE
jgi:hypothetical protein